MGAFLINHYLYRYSPNNIKGVFLISPAGTTKFDKSNKNSIPEIPQMNRFKKLLVDIGGY